MLRAWGDGFERLAFVFDVTLRGSLDEIGNQVVAALELHVNLGVGVLEPIAQGDEFVVTAEVSTKPMRPSTTTSTMTTKINITGIFPLCLVHLSIGQRPPSGNDNLGVILESPGSIKIVRSAGVIQRGRRRG